MGTVVGVTNPREFYFAVTPGTVQLQDIVCVDMDMGLKGSDSEREETAGTSTVRVWAKVVNIERINPLFPEEAAQELSVQRISALDTVVPLSREIITAKCTILGREERLGEKLELRPLTYPLQPASSVYLADPKTVTELLTGNIPKYRWLQIGHLRGHEEFPAYLDAHAIVARHLAVLATTGAGKTVTVRRILEELTSKTRYPVLILDPHSDYIGLKELPELKDRVVIYSPKLHLEKEKVENIIQLVQDLSGEKLTPPQESLLEGLITLVKSSWAEDNGYRWSEDKKDWEESGGKGGWKKNSFVRKHICEKANKKYCLHLDTHHFFCLHEVLDTIRRLNEEGEKLKDLLKEAGHSEILDGLSNSVGPVLRRLSKAAGAYCKIRDTSKNRLKDLEPMPLPVSSEMEEIIQHGRISIISLEGCGHLAPAIVANLLERLSDLRMEGKIPRFLTVVEEAHNFIPSSAETPSPSAGILRQIATEGRKYGMGLILISQRPSRVDSTVLAQCNSFVILRIINPADQKYVREVVETLGEDDARILPDLATGEALITGECVRFPILVQVEMPSSKGYHEEEDFVKEFCPGDCSDALSDSTHL